KKELEEKFGFSFFLNSQCQEITGNGKATGVLLATGQVIPGDLIIVSAGIRPKLDLAKAIGLKTERGIAVDEHMETSRSGIYAAGDVAEFNGMVYGLWPAAQQQGEIAGVNMAGGKQEYGGTVPSNALSILGINVMSAGDIDVEGKHQGLVKEDKANYTYRKYVVSNDILIGTVLLNDIRGGGEIMGAIRQKKNVLPYKDAILQDSFDFKSLS
ncbi:MAG: FAD-dependent oxidoreductase, partial [Dehalococcoidia bacterium]|nr:FAD-dependent oxidoreductase [Dehalococcoidia bacterium]